MAIVETETREGSYQSGLSIRPLHSVWPPCPSKPLMGQGREGDSHPSRSSLAQSPSPPPAGRTNRQGLHPPVGALQLRLGWMGAAAARASRALASSPLPARCCVVFSHFISLSLRVLAGTMEIIQLALTGSNGVKTESKHQASVRGGTALSWPERGREIQ